MLIKTAIVVDDLEQNRNVNGKTAQRRGLDVETFATLDDAESFVFDHDDPLLVILDHNFEGDRRTGFHLCNEIRTRHPFGLLMPIIYVSGFLDSGPYIDEQRGRMMFGPTVFLPKHAMHELGDVIDTFLNGFDGLWELAVEQCGFQALYRMTQEV